MKLSTLISVKQLTEALCKSHKNLRVLDSSWHMPATNRNPYAEYLEGHIPGALFFDIEECIDKKSEYDHMLPSTSDFEKYVGKLGINNNTHVVVYDNNEVGLFSAPRVWWTFRVFGHNSVSILDGGLPRWQTEGQPISKEVKSVNTETFTAKFNSEAVKPFEDMLINIAERKFQMADGRSAGRFYGTENEPRPGMVGGHIPGAKSVPFKCLMTEDKTGYQTLRPTNELEEIFKDKGIDLSKPLTASCGSGITACCIALAAFMCGKEDTCIYDGSWVEYYYRSKPEQRTTSD